MLSLNRASQIADSIYKNLTKRQTELDILLDKKQELNIAVNKLEKEINELDDIRKALTGASEMSRRKAIYILENTVTPMIQGVIGQEYSFRIKTTVERGKPAVEFLIVTTIDGVESEQDPTAFCGGGLIDSISTALRYAYLSLYDGGINNAILLDEPGKMVSENASVEFARFIKQLGTTYSRQTIMCTHSPGMAYFADRTIEVTKPGDVSIVNYK